MPSDEKPPARPWARVHDSFEDAEQAEREYYASLTPDERIAAVEEMRQRWMKMKGLPDLGVQKVVRVFRR